MGFNNLAMRIKLNEINITDPFDQSIAQPIAKLTLFSTHVRLCGQLHPSLTIGC